MVRISDVLKGKEPEDRELKERQEFFIQTAKGEKKAPAPAESQKVYNQSIDLMRKIFAETGSLRGEEVRRIVESLARRLEEDDPELINLTRTSSEENYLFAHSVNVSILAIKLGLALSYGHSKLIDLGMAAFLHDLGMSRVMEIAKRPRKLSKKELSEIKRHPAYGAELLDRAKDMEELIREVISQHHETENGLGYPQGLKNGEIHEYARIIGLVDIYEALTHPRVYRKEFMPYLAMKMIIDSSGTLFQSSLAKALVEELSIYPVGSLVRLNTNEVGRVVVANKGFPIRPQVEVLFDAEGEKLKEPRAVNLIDLPSLYIKEPLSEADLK